MTPRKLIKQLGIKPEFEIEPINEEFGSAYPGRVEKFEALLGQRLPEDYRLFITHLAPCLFAGVPEFRPLERNSFMSKDSLFCDMGLFHGFYATPNINDLIRSYDRRKSRVPDGMFIIGDSDGGDILMSLNDPPGRIYFQLRDPQELTLCANSFTEFLQSFEILPDEDDDEDDEGPIDDPYFDDEDDDDDEEEDKDSGGDEAEKKKPKKR